MADLWVPTAEHPDPPHGFSNATGGNYKGSGNPEGVVTALIGEAYWDYTNKVWYVKDSNDGGNTGWREEVA